MAESGRGGWLMSRCGRDLAALVRQDSGRATVASGLGPRGRPLFEGVPLKSPGNPIDPLILTPMMTGVPDCQDPGQTLLGVQVGIWKGVKFDFI